MGICFCDNTGGFDGNGNLHTPIRTDALTDPPVASDLDTIYGEPGKLPIGFRATHYANSKLYEFRTHGSSWFRQEFTLTP